MERDPYFETTEEWLVENIPEGCLHGVPWDEDCYECELYEESFFD